MNLINDAWIPVIRADGRKENIAPWQIAESDNPVMEIISPRPDFQGALYQFLIGLMQTTLAPQDEDEWFDKYDEGLDVKKVTQSFGSVADFFSIGFENDIAFMQAKEDFEGEMLPIEDLVGGELSDNTLKNNTDLFVKQRTIKTLSPHWAALAVFNVQTTGVLAWGQHRVGLRGNGPITNLLIDDGSPLWRTLWLNVLEKEQGKQIPGDWSKKSCHDIFPWTGGTRTSEKKEETLPSDVNPLQHYWPMPRRIRLLIEASPCVCDVSGEKTQYSVRSYKRIKDGVHYSGPWNHPLSAHKQPFNKKEKRHYSPMPFLAKDASYGFADWVSWLIGETRGEDYFIPSYVILHNLSSRRIKNLKAWCFGYRASNAKVTGFVDIKMPSLLVDEAHKDHFSALCSELLTAIEATVSAVKENAAQAKFGVTDSEKKRNSNDIKGFKKRIDIDLAFYAKIEGLFYELINTLNQEIAQCRTLPPSIAQKIFKSLTITAFELFDYFVFLGDDDSQNMRRVVKARNNLKQCFSDKSKLKPLKHLKQIASIENTVEVI